MQNPDPHHNAVVRAYVCMILALLGLIAINASASLESPLTLHFSSFIAGQ